MSRRRSIPSDKLWFIPEPDYAPALVVRKETDISIRLYDEQRKIFQGTYSTLYDAYVDTTYGEQMHVAVKVFHSTEHESDAITEFLMYLSARGLNGAIPLAVAFGHAWAKRGIGEGLPAIMMEFVVGESAKVAGEAVSKCAPVSERLDNMLDRAMAIALSVAAINEEAGIRHGDLSYTNVFLRTLPGGGFKAILIDLSQAALKQRPDTYGKHGTDFFSAKELFVLTSDGYLRCRSSADAYSIGALMAYLLLIADYESFDAFRRAYHDAENYGFYGVSKWATLDATGDVATLAAAVGLLIAACMRENPSERRAISEIIDDLRVLCTPELRTEANLSALMKSLRGHHVEGDVLPSSYAMYPSLHITGRDAEKAQIAKHLTHDRVCYVCGFGGIGKSSVGISFAADASTPDGCYGVKIKRVYCIAFDTSAAESLARVAADASPEMGARPAHEAADWLLGLMERELWSDDLVIIDDVHVTGKTLEQVMGPFLDRMLSYGRYKLIITSRYPENSRVFRHAVHIDSLAAADLKTIYLDQAATTEVPDDALLARLFEAVGKNTLVVKLTGGLIGGGLLELSELVGVFEGGRLGNELIDAYDVDADADGQHMNMRDRVKRLVALTADVLTPKERSLMARLLLLPKQGVSTQTLKKALRAERSQLECAFVDLLAKGLVERTDQGTKISLHTLVRTVCLDTKVLDDPLFESKRFLNVLWDVLQDALEVADLACVSDVEGIYRTAIELAHDTDTSIDDTYLNTLLQRRSDALRGLGRTSERIVVTKELVSRLEAQGSDRDTSGAGVCTWAQAVVDHAGALSDAGRYFEAYQATDGALEQLGWNEDGTVDAQSPIKSGDPELQVLVAKLLAKRGYATHELSTIDGTYDLTKALADKRAAYEIISAVGDEWQRAMVLHTLAFTEYHVGLRAQAIRDAEEAIELIRTSCHTPTHERSLLFATCLNYLGFFLCNNEDDACVPTRFTESLSIKEQAIRIRYSWLPPTHIDIARSHNNIAISLRRIAWASDDGEMQRAALTHALISKRIREEISSAECETKSRLLEESLEALKQNMGLEEADVQRRYATVVIPSKYDR